MIKRIYSIKKFLKLNYIVNLILFVSITISFRFFILFLKYNNSTQDWAISFLYFIVSIAVAVLPLISSHTKSKIIQLIKQNNIYFQIVVIILNIPLFVLFLYPHTRFPQIYSITYNPNSNDNSVYSIEIITNQTANSIILYDNNKKVDELSQYQRAKNKHTFTTTMLINSPEVGHKITSDILLSSGEIIKNDIYEYIAPIIPETLTSEEKMLSNNDNEKDIPNNSPSVISDNSNWVVTISYTPINDINDALSLPDLSEYGISYSNDIYNLNGIDAYFYVYTNFDASSVILSSISQTQAYDPIYMKCTDNRHWISAVRFVEESTFKITATAYAANGQHATADLTVAYPFN